MENLTLRHQLPLYQRQDAPHPGQVADHEHPLLRQAVHVNGMP